MPEILHSFVRDGLTHLIVQANEVVVEVVIEPAVDQSDQTVGYRFWLRSTGEVFATAADAQAAALADIRRFSRVQGIVPATGFGIFSGC